jgi:hypothetical protein
VELTWIAVPANLSMAMAASQSKKNYFPQH